MDGRLMTKRRVIASFGAMAVIGATAFGAASASAIGSTPPPTLSVNLPSIVGNGGDLRSASVSASNPATGSPYTNERFDFVITGPSGFDKSDLVLKYDAGSGNYQPVPLSDAGSGTVTGYIPPQSGEVLLPGGSLTKNLQVATSPTAPVGNLTFHTSLDSVNSSGSVTGTQASHDDTVTTTVPSLTLTAPSMLTVGADFTPFTGRLKNQTGSNYGGTDPSHPQPAGVRLDFTIGQSGGTPRSFKASDLTLQYDAGSGNFQTIPLSDGTDGTITGFFGPGSGFALPNGADNTTSFRIKINSAAPHGSLSTSVALDKVNSSGDATGTDSSGVPNGTVTTANAGTTSVIDLPSAPTNVAATTDTGVADVNVTWNPPADNGNSAITGYSVLLLDSNGKQAGSNNNLPASTTSFTFTSTNSQVMAGQTYTAQVAAQNGAGQGPAATSNAVTAGENVPDAPTNVKATAGDQTVTVTYTAPAANGSPITGYTVTLYKFSDNTVVTSTTVSDTSATFTAADGVATGTSYYGRVAATNGIGTGPQSDKSNVATTAAAHTAPGAPMNVSASAGDRTVTVTFDAPASNGGSAITKYTVTLYQFDNDMVVKSADTSASDMSATFTAADGVVNGTRYYARVTATNGVGAGAASDKSNVVTPAPPTKPGVPANVTATAGDQQVTVTFDPPADNGGSQVTGYTVTLYDNTDGSQVAQTTTTDTSVTFGASDKVVNGTPYYATVVATNAVGDSDPAKSDVVTPAAVPGAPTNVAATGGDQRVTVTFDAPSNTGGSSITGYTVTLYASSNNTQVATDTITDPSTTTATFGPADNVVNGTAYYAKVAATNGVGTGPQSDKSNDVTPSTVPGAPTNVQATPGDQTVSATFDAPSNTGGSPITGYMATLYKDTDNMVVTSKPVSDPSNRQVSFTASDGVVNGTAYYVKVAATNANGTGSNSDKSNTVTPVASAPAFAKSLPAVHRGNVFYLRNSLTSGNADQSFHFGNTTGDSALWGDWNGDGKSTAGVYRASTGTFYLLNDDKTVTAVRFGNKGGGDYPLVGDWNGDGTTTIGVYRTGTGTFYLLNDNKTVTAVRFGNTKGDFPVVGDWNGDGKDTVGVDRVATATFYLSDDNRTSRTPTSYGQSGGSDFPVVGDWDGDHVDTIGVVRGSRWYVSKDNTATLTSFSYGSSSDQKFVWSMGSTAG